MSQIQSFAKQMLNALMVMHTPYGPHQKIIHADIKPENIVLKYNKQHNFEFEEPPY